MRGDLGWGPDIPYMITGQLNQHPRAAMQFNDSPERGNFIKFYDQIMAED
jgi:4-hydroxy 2-oxovalerate aldolase